MIFQILECVQAFEDAWKEAKLTSERLAHEKDQIIAFLESERNKISSLSQEKNLALGEKQLALKEKELALELKTQALEEKQEATEEW